MKKIPTFSEFKKEALKNKKLRLEYEKIQPKFEFINQLIITGQNTKRL